MSVSRHLLFRLDILINRMQWPVKLVLPANVKKSLQFKWSDQLGWVNIVKFYKYFESLKTHILALPFWLKICTTYTGIFIKNYWNWKEEECTSWDGDIRRAHSGNGRTDQDSQLCFRVNVPCFALQIIDHEHLLELWDMKRTGSVELIGKLEWCWRIH